MTSQAGPTATPTALHTIRGRAASDPIPPEVDVLIIGGGITGCSAAYFLAEAGARVALVERLDLSTESSGRNAGSLHGQIQHPAFVDRGESWARDFLPALEFLIHSVTLWTNLSNLLGVDLEVTTNGGLLVAETTDQMRAIERKVQIENEGGFGTVVIGRSELRDLAPYISDTMLGAELAPSEGVANPLFAASAFASAAEARGASIHTSTDVQSVDSGSRCFTVTTTRGRIRCRRVVIAAGSGVARITDQLGMKLPIEDAAVQLSVTEPIQRMVDHLVYFAGGALTFKQAKAGSLLIGGGWPANRDPESGRVSVSIDSLRRNLEVARARRTEHRKRQDRAILGGHCPRDAGPPTDDRPDPIRPRRLRRALSSHGTHRGTARGEGARRSDGRRRTGP